MADNNVNLAALWVPVMPETRELAPAMKKAGEESKRAFEEAFKGGSGGGSGPEQVGSEYAQRFSKSFKATFEGLPIPNVFKEFAGTVDEHTKVSEAALGRLKASVTSTYGEYAKALQDVQKHQTEAARLQEYYNQRVAEGKGAKYQDTLRMIGDEHQRTSAAASLAVQKQNEYNAAVAKMKDAHQEAAQGSQLLTAAIGGIGGAIATLGIEAVIKGFEGMGEAIHKAAELTVEAVKFVTEAGETFEGFEHQITEFSTTSGAAFDSLSASAGKVFEQLDVKGEDTGKTLAILHSRLGVTGDVAETLTKHIEELGGRFGQIRADALTAAFVQFGISGETADQHLANLLQSTRDAGVNFADVANGMKSVAATAVELGMSFDQAGVFVSDMTARGETAQTSITALDHAQTVFSKQGLSFADGMKEASKELKAYKDAGDDIDADALSQKLFGRRWADGVAILHDYDEAMSRLPASFDATSQSIDTFNDKTATIGDKFQALKNQVETLLNPLGKTIIDVLGHAIEHVHEIITEHHGDIVAKIGDIGHSFINALPDIQNFVEGAIRMMGQFANVMMEVIPDLIGVFGGLTDIWAQLTGNDKLHDSMVKMGESLKDLQNKDLSKIFNDAADGVHNWDINTKGLNTDLDELLGKDAENSTLGTSLGNLAGNPLFNPGLPQLPAAPGTGNAPSSWWGSGAKIPSGTKPTPGPIPTGPPSMGPGNTLAPLDTGGAPGAPIPKGPQGNAVGNTAAINQYLTGTDYGTPAKFQANRQLAMSMFPWDASEWDAFDWLVGKESHYDPTALSSAGATGIGQFMPATWSNYGVPGGSSDPAQQLALMFQYIYNRYGTPSAAKAQYYNHKGGEGSYQTGGFIPDAGGYVVSPDDPDLAARGLRKYYPYSPPGRADWEAQRRTGTGKFAWPYLGWNPEGQSGNISPGLKLDTSTTRQGGPSWWSQYLGKFAMPFYDDPLERRHARINEAEPWNLHFQGGGQLSGFGGGDTVPIWAERGEFMVRKEAARQWGPMLNWINAQGYTGGGSVLGGDDVGVDTQILAVEGMAKQLGLTLTAGKSGHGTHDIDKGYHDSGQAGDFGDGSPGNSPAKLQFAQYMFSHFGSELAELIYDDPAGMPQLIKDGKAVAPSFYGSALPDHKNHVHVAILATQALTDLGSPGSAPIVAGNTSAAAAMGDLGPYNPAGNVARGSAGQFPGLPGQYGGYGTYGAETYDEAYQAQKRVTDAKQRATDMDTQITAKNKEIDDLNTQIGQLKTGLLDDPSKRESLNNRLDAAKTELDRLTRERIDQTGAINEAERKQLEDANKAPAEAKARTQKATGTQAFEQLGGGLLKGVADELGLGDVFGKPPWEWGIVKLATGLANWGIGTANAWAGEIGKGHTGVTNFQPIPGFDDSGGSGGLNIGGIQLPSFGNMGQQQQNVSNAPNVNAVPSPGFGQPLGPAPGPAQNNFTVVQNGTNMSDVQSWQTANNANNSAIVNTGNMPVAHGG